MNHNHLSFIFEDFLQLLVRYKDSIFKKEDINSSESEYISDEETQEIIDNISAKIESYSNLINQNQQSKSQVQRESTQTNSKSTADFHKEFSELQYIMVSLADEVFLNTKWSGVKYWEKNMIEQRLFNSHIAGQEIFQRIDNILDSTSHNIPNNKAHRSGYLINIYLQLLAMNFRGKYNVNIHSTKQDEIQSDKTISNYKNALLKAAYSDRDVKKIDKIFPKTYYYTIENFSKDQLKNKSLGAYIIISLLSLYLITSFGIWEYFSIKLNQSIML